MLEPKDLHPALHKYAEFTQLEPDDVTSRAGNIPKEFIRLGEAQQVMYRSRKWGEGVYNYVHDHEGAVDVYVPGRGILTPAALGNVQTLVLLGKCLGFKYTDYDGETISGVGSRPYPMLYASPSGKYLLVVDISGRTARVHAALWGGKLAVRGEGIVG